VPVADRISAAVAPLAVTMGDPAGIGLEIAVKAWAGRASRPVPRFALYADPAAVTACASRFGVPLAVAEVASPRAAAAAFDTALPIVAVTLAELPKPGKPSSRNAAAVVEAIDRAAAAVVSGEAGGLVTNPIAKSVLYGIGFRHPGHTEYLAHLSARLTSGVEPQPVMMLAGGGLRVVPLTVHVPLANVPQLVTAALIHHTVVTLVAALRRDFGIEQPRIAVAGLNPHAGESGTIGREDAEVIAPAIRQLVAEGYGVTGPHSADTLFHAAARARYDAAVAMYHDQALIPLKTLAFETGVNVTLGLPFVRTSPDHGTAFDIAGTGQASAESLIAALDVADAMARSRARVLSS
jgi:4-hydroxythreonine-4-phosphate dehydrogenase